MKNKIRFTLFITGLLALFCYASYADTSPVHDNTLASSKTMSPIFSCDILRGLELTESPDAIRGQIFVKGSEYDLSVYYPGGANKASFTVKGEPLSYVKFAPSAFSITSGATTRVSSDGFVKLEMTWTINQDGNDNQSTVFDPSTNYQISDIPGGTSYTYGQTVVFVHYNKITIDARAATCYYNFDQTLSVEYASI